MYLTHFALNEKPFSISPDPRFLFMSNRYREALTHLTYGVQEGGGFVLLTGEVGTGKTTVCRCLLQQLPKNTRLAFVLNPKLNSLELLATICDELKIDYPEDCESLKILTDRLTTYLLACHQENLNVVIMIDEAQNLATEVLEQIRLLTNLETNQKKLLQIILVGQPELQEKLAQRNLRQLAQRVTARYHLRPLNLKETMAYVIHRVRIAGCNKNLFSRSAIEYLHAKTQGIPRLINTISDRALLGAANHKKNNVDKKIMAQSVIEIMGESYPAQKENDFNRWLKPIVISLAIVLLAGLSFWIGKNNQSIDDNQSVDKNRIVDQKNKTDAVQQIKPKSEDFFEQLIGDQPWDYNGIGSLQSLLSLWKIEYAPLKDGQACAFAADYGLKCRQGKAQWDKLRELNRPAVLKFSAGINGEFWGILKSLHDNNATIIFGKKESKINIERLSPFWTGEFILFWQSPQGFNDNIKVGDSGESVAWLSGKLNSINQIEQPTQKVFNQELKQQLMQFQLQRNIKADGIAGMQTILKINVETLSGIPLLTNFN